MFYLTIKGKPFFHAYYTILAIHDSGAGQSQLIVFEIVEKAFVNCAVRIHKVCSRHPGEFMP